MIKKEYERVYRVPHCSECERCKYTQMPWSNTKDYKCYEEGASEYGTFVGYLGVDHPSKVSPMWCPKRVKEKLYYDKIKY